MKVKVDAALVQEEPAFEVWRSNRRSVMAFLACETQWRFAVGFGAAMRLGIDYGSARPFFERRNGRVDRQMLDDLQIMERAALEAFAEVEK
ncbi:MAG: DUF1799 domain-containing protein [Rhizobiales bacterium]|nr:DUF1799 domain-containing protein [Hyphomicrobiales bacterium]